MDKAPKNTGESKEKTSACEEGRGYGKEPRNNAEALIKTESLSRVSYKDKKTIHVRKGSSEHWFMYISGYHPCFLLLNQNKHWLISKHFCG